MKKTALTLAGAVCLSMLSPLAAHAEIVDPSTPPDTQLTSGLNNRWAQQFGVNLVGLVPGDSDSMSVVIENAGTRKARAEWGYFYSIPRGDVKNAFFDDVKVGWGEQTPNLVSMRSTFLPATAAGKNLNDPAVQDTFVSHASDVLLPGQKGMATFGYEYQSSSTTPPPAGTYGQMGLAVRLYGIEDPAQPTIDNQPGINNDTVTFPADNDCIAYTDQTFDKVSGRWSVKATAFKMCEFEDGSKTRVLSGVVGLTDVTMSNPTIIDKPGTSDDSVTSPADTDGIHYTVLSAAGDII